MNKLEFDSLIGKAASGDVQSICEIADFAFYMATGAKENNDPQAAIDYISAANEWLRVAEWLKSSGMTDVGDDLAPAIELTKSLFKNCF